MAGGVLVLALGSPVREASEITLGAGVLAIVVSYALVSHYPLILAPLVLSVAALTAALRWAPVSVVVPMDYSSLLWATATGWLVFGVLPGRWTWVGAPIIILSGLYIVWREHVRRVSKPIEIAQ